MNRYIIPFAITVVFLVQVFSSCNTKSTTKEKANVSDSTKSTESSVKNEVKSPENNIVETKDNSNIANSSNTNPNDELIVLNSTAQKWSGGVKGSGSGINYRFTLITKFASTDLIIDKLWIDTTFHTVEVKQKKSFDINKYNSNDTIIIYASDYFKSPDRPKFEGEDKQSTEIEKPNIKPPYNYNGAALIGYTLKGVRKYKVIDSIQKLNPLYYP